MATFNTNQVRQLYVVDSLKASGDLVPTDPSGTLVIKGIPAATNPFGETYFYFNQQGADGAVRSDIIKPKLTTYLKATAAADMARPLKRYEVTLDPAINGGLPVAGQTYELEIYFREWVGLSPEDQYYKFGVVNAFTGMTAAQFYAALRDSLVMNFEREPAQVLSFTLDNDATPTKLIVEEVEQPWSLGTEDSPSVNFSLNTDEILLNGDYVKWGIITPVTPVNFVPNGHEIADMEYFYHGERGDVYRNVGWPRVWKTTYQVDPNKTYDVIDIRFNFQGENHAVQFSQKDVTLVIPTDAGITNDVITAIETASGLTIAKSPSL